MSRRSRSLAFLVTLAATGCTRAGGGKAPRYDTAKVEHGELVAKVTATGTVSALVTVQVGSQVSGRIQEIMVDFNTRVEKGQVVARIDPQLFDAAVEQARANYVAAQSNLAKAKVQLEDAERQRRRASKLLEQSVGAQADFDAAEAAARQAAAQVTAVEAAVEQSKASLHQAEVNLGYTTIVSPINGVVISRNVDVGQTVAASLSSPTLFTIAEDLARMQVDTNVAESDIGKIAPDMEASFTVDAYPGDKFGGRVRQVRNAPITSQNVVTYDAVIDVGNRDLKLRPGMTANVTFVWARRENALLVPNGAMRFHPPDEIAGAGRTGRGGGEKRGEGGPPEGSKTESATPGPDASGEKSGGEHRRWRREGGGRRRTSAGAPGEGRRRWGGEEGSSNRRTVYVLDAGAPRPVELQVGVTDGSRTEVLGGDLAEGAIVITGGGESAGGARPPDGRPGGGFGRLF
ncbi:MAG: efflux RND transporter periplasmic adaptor subunit [Acidobacteriota bacterium]